MNSYFIQSENGRITIKTEVEPDQLQKRLNQISRAFKIATFNVTDSDNKTVAWTYNQASELREQLETLVVQNFKDAWGESKSSVMFDTALTEEEIEKDRLVDEYLFNYLQDLELLIKQQSGLFT